MFRILIYTASRNQHPETRMLTTWKKKSPSQMPQKQWGRGITFVATSLKRPIAGILWGDPQPTKFSRPKIPMEPSLETPTAATSPRMSYAPTCANARVSIESVDLSCSCFTIQYVSICGIHACCKNRNNYYVVYAIEDSPNNCDMFQPILTEGKLWHIKPTTASSDFSRQQIKYLHSLKLT